MGGTEEPPSRARGSSTSLQSFRNDPSISRAPATASSRPSYSSPGIFTSNPCPRIGNTCFVHSPADLLSPLGVYREISTARLARRRRRRVVRCLCSPSGVLLPVCGSSGGDTISTSPNGSFAIIVKRASGRCKTSCRGHHNISVA